MEAKLIGFTSEPLEKIVMARMVMDHKDFEEAAVRCSYKEQEEIFRSLLRDELATPLEFVSTVWVIKGSRAFQQQLTRHRIGFSFAIQSLRITDMRNFFEQGVYHMPEFKTEKAKEEFKKAMLQIESSYKEILKDGKEKIEDARALLPLCVESPIMMSCTFRALLHMCEVRLCKKAQGEFRECAEQMKKEVSQKMGKIFGEALQPICRDGKCHFVDSKTCKEYVKYEQR